MPRITVAQHERQLNRVNRRRQHWTAAGERQDADRDRHRPLREAPALARQTAQSQNSVSDARRRTFPSSTDVSRNFFVAHKTCRRMLASKCLIKHVIRVTVHKASITFLRLLQLLSKHIWSTRVASIVLGRLPGELSHYAC